MKPSLGDDALRQASVEVWQTFGRTLGEMPHMLQMIDECVTVEMPSETRSLLTAQEPVLIVSGHIGNWELMAQHVDGLGGTGVFVYNSYANPLIEQTIQRQRAMRNARWVDKDDALRAMLKTLRNGGRAGALVDTRVDSGMALPFFGVDAMTTIGAMRIAVKLGVPVLPLSVERSPGPRFTVRWEPPLKGPEGGTELERATALTLEFYAHLERWIVERPGQWLCTKRRWPK